MNKRIITTVSLLIGIVLVTSCCNNKANDNNEKIEINKTYTKEPISKENAINILKSEYGDMIQTKEEELKKVGEEYIVDVYIELLTDEEESHDELEEHHHSKSIGIHKINTFTGELTKPE